MALIVPHEGDVQLLTELLSNGEDWLLCLYTAGISITENTKYSDISRYEANFQGYSQATLTRSISPSTWSQPVSIRPAGSPATWISRSQVGHSQYGVSPILFECTAGFQTIYGYFAVGSESGALIFAEGFATYQMVSPGNPIPILPVLETA